MSRASSARACSRSGDADVELPERPRPGPDERGSAGSGPKSVCPGRHGRVRRGPRRAWRCRVAAGAPFRAAARTAFCSTRRRTIRAMSP